MKIAFFVQWMLCGGVENALITLTDKLIEMGNEVSVYVIHVKGEFLFNLSEKVNVKPIPMPEQIRKNIPVGGTTVTVRECMKNREYVRAVYFVLKHKLGKEKFAELNVNKKRIPMLDEKYDIAVNYHMHSPFLVWYLSERVIAKKKYTWVHNDFSTTGYSIELLKQYLECNASFYCVSKQLKDELEERLPEYKGRIYIARNIVNQSRIIEQAEEYYPTEYMEIQSSKIKLLTVGRLEERKGYDLAIEAGSRLASQGIDFHWFILGDGTLRNYLIDMVRDKKLEENFSFLGVKNNPYPYFKNCDIYVQTSRHEGFVTTVTEAKILKCPIICTDVSGAREQIRDGETGDICEISVEGIYEKLSRLIQNADIRKQYHTNLLQEKQEAENSWLHIFET